MQKTVVFRLGTAEVAHLFEDCIEDGQILLQQ